MTTTISYNNTKLETISLTQASQLGSYIKILTEDGVIKTVTTFNNGMMLGINYIVSSLDEANSILQSDSNATFEVISQANNYEIADQLSYRNGSLVGKRKVVNDKFGSTLCLQVFDVSTDLPNYLLTSKFYHDETGEIIYEFIYNADGSCFSIDQSQVIDFDSEFYASQIGNDASVSFT